MNSFNTQVIISLLVILETISVGYQGHLEAVGRDEVSPVDLIAPLVLLITFCLAGYFVLFAKWNGIRSSGIQFIFWFLLVVSGIPAFRYQIGLALKAEGIGNHMFLFVINMCYYPLIVCEFLLHCFADGVPQLTSTDEDSERSCPEIAASFPSRLGFFWFDKLIRSGYRRPLEINELWDVNTGDKSKSIVPPFEHMLQKRLQEAKREGVSSTAKKTVSVLPIICRSFGWSFAFVAFLSFLEDLLYFGSPQILQLLISFVENSEEEEWKGYFYAVLLFLVTMLVTVISTQASKISYVIEMNVGTALISTVYRKALKMSNAARKESTVGEIVNLMSVDVKRISEAAENINMLWSAPLQIALSIYFLWQILGPSVLAGLSVLIVLVPINGVLAMASENFITKQMENKDMRMKIMNEILSGIKVIKLYGWEPSFHDRVSEVRKKEVSVLKREAYLEAVMWFLWTTTPFLIILMSFGTYLWVDKTHVLDASKIFVSLALFNILEIPLYTVPWVIVSAIQARVSLKRINKFINSEDLDPDIVDSDSREEDPVIIDNGTFSWSREEDPQLKNINLRIEAGSLVAVVGSVGAGKSSVLSAILGEMEKREGRISCKGSFAYVSQIAWIQNATLKENILFGKFLDEEKYPKILEACALTTDLQTLPAGDDTEIGERGINLSGGQKQRVSLARAVYNDADVYLLDDPLSAVDSHVGKHLFDKVIGPEGVLRKKTRILVTHAIVYLPYVDYIIVMNEGEVSESGTYDELLQKKGAFAKFLMEHLANEGGTENEGIGEIIQALEKTVGPQEFQRQLSRLSSKDNSDTSDLKDSMQLSKRKDSQTSTTPQKQTSKDADGDEEKRKGTLVEEEKSETGRVKRDVYWYYLRAGGTLMLLTAFAFQVLYRVSTIGSGFWLVIWSNQARGNVTQDTATRDMYLGIYASIGLGGGLSTIIASIAISTGLLTAAKKLHNTMLYSILRSPMSFFDTTPTGRILNRFSNDVEALDTKMPFIISEWIYYFLGVLGTLGVIVSSTPIFASVILPVGIVYYFVQQYYVATSRQLQRLESISDSPICSHFSESVTGATTIRAYRQQERFINESENYVDRNHSCTYANTIANRWLAIRLESIGNVLIFFAALFSVLARHTLSPGLVGLSVSYALDITFLLNYLVRMSCSVETRIVSAERIKEYSETTQEAPWRMTGGDSPPGWPDCGKISFQEYQTRYREGLDLVLKGVTCEIGASEKVGIVGRTGAGKSSLTLALFRLIESSSGRILIDGIDVSKLGLHDLRQNLTIIPQDPVLFSGTMRMNLDPFSRYKDDDLWTALELAHLKSFVQELRDGLEHEIAEGGENLSVGQRQLVCLARALLKKTRILVLDEATASVDLETDDLIQRTIRTAFADCTVLTIAHRLKTIMDSNRVLVLDNGFVKEFDRPDTLIQDKSSIFHRMAVDAGLV